METNEIVMNEEVEEENYGGPTFERDSGLGTAGGVLIGLLIAAIGAGIYKKAIEPAYNWFKTRKARKVAEDSLNSSKGPVLEGEVEQMK